MSMLEHILSELRALAPAGSIVNVDEHLQASGGEVDRSYSMAVHARPNSGGWEHTMIAFAYREHRPEALVARAGAQIAAGVCVCSLCAEIRKADESSKDGGQ
jgi:hypothetical protein